MSRLQQDCEGAPFNNMFVDMWTACSFGKARPISTSRLTRLRTVVAGWLRDDLTAAGLGIDVVEARRCTPPDSGNGRSTASCVFPADSVQINRELACRVEGEQGPCVRQFPRSLRVERRGCEQKTEQQKIA